MVTVAHLAKNMLKERMLLDEYLKAGLVNYAALAEEFRPRLEQELGKPVEAATIAMALRRYAESAKKKDIKRASLKDSELIMKGGLCDIVVYKSPSLFQKLEKLYHAIDYTRGDTLNIIHGNYEVSIIINEKFEKKCLALLKDEKILHKENNLVALTLKFGKRALYTPGVTFSILKQLVMENINLIEIVSSLVEITFVIDKSDATKGYRALQEFVEGGDR